MLSHQSVKIVKIPCHSKDMAFSIKCTLFLFSWEINVFEYETAKFFVNFSLPNRDDKLRIAASEQSLASKRIQ